MVTKLRGVVGRPEELDQPAPISPGLDYVQRAYASTGGVSPFDSSGKFRYTSPTANDPLSTYRSNNAAVDFLSYIGRANPVAASMTIRSPYAMAVAPEVAVAIRQDDIATQFMEQAFSAGDALPEDTYLTDLQARGLEELGQQVSPRVMDALQYVMSQLEEQGQDIMVAQLLDYVAKNPQSDPASELATLDFLRRTGTARQQFEISNDTYLGRLSEGFRIVTGLDAIKTGAANAWAHAASPQDAWYRKALSFGQNVEISTYDLGVDLPIPNWGPLTAIDMALQGGEAARGTRSGIVDGITEIAFDPLTYVAGYASGAKIAKTLPIAKGVAKPKLAAQALIPIKGANALRLPFGSRGISSRMGYLAHAKTIDDMLLTKQGTKLVEWLAQTNDAALIIDRIPQWENSIPLVNSIANDASTPDQVRDLIRWGVEGGFGESNPMRVQLANVVADADERLDAAIKPRTVAISDVLRETRDGSDTVVLVPTAQVRQWNDPGVLVDDLLREEGYYLDSMNEGTGLFEQIGGVRDVGIQQPIVIKMDSTGRINVEDGNHRLALAVREGIDYVPVRVTGNKNYEWRDIADAVGDSGMSGWRRPGDGPLPIQPRGDRTLEGLGIAGEVEEVDEIARRGAVSSGQIQINDNGFLSRPDRLKELSEDLGDGVYVWNDSVVPDGIDTAPTSLVLWTVGEDGNVKAIGSLVGDPEAGFNLGVDAAYKGNDYGVELLRRSGHTPEELASGLGSVSEAGAAAINKAFGLGDYAAPKLPLQVIDGGSRYSSDLGIFDEVSPGVLRYVDGYQQDDAVRVLINPNSGVLNMTDGRVVAAVEKYIVDNDLWKAGDDVAQAEEYARMYAKANGYDVIHMGDEAIVLNESAIIRGIDAKNPEVGDDITSLIVDRWNAQRNLAEFDAGTKTSAWIIKDMPTGKIIRQLADPVDLKPRRFGGTSNSNSWWKRTIKARMFGKYPPSEIKISSLAEGGIQLKRFLQYVGVKHDDILEMMNRWYGSKFHERYGIVRDILTEAGEQIEHPLIRHKLVEWFNRQGTRAFGMMEDGSEVLTTQSSTLGRETARPFIPSMLTETFELPDPKSLVEQLRRYKWATHAGPRLTAGLLPSTRGRRAAIVNKIKAKLGKDAAGLSDEELLAIAYASVGPGSAGNAAYGAVAKMRNTTTRAWRGLVSVFSIAQLAFRPFAWSGRVLLDENARAAFADLPTVMRSPVRWLSSTMDAYHLGKANEYRALNLQWARDTMRTLRAIDNQADRLAEAKKIITNFDELVRPEDVEALITNPDKLNRIIARMLNEAAVKNDFGQIVGGVSARRQRVYNRAIRVGEELGIDVTRQDFTWADDVSEIANKGWATMYGMNHKVTPVEFIGGQMTNAGAEEYARVWHNNLQVLSSDPLIRFALGRMEAGYLGRAFGGDAAILQSTGWKRLEPYAQQWAEQKGYGPLRGYALLSRYADEILVPYTRNVYGDFLGTDAANNARILREIIDTKTADIDGVTFSFTKGNEGFAALDGRVAQANAEGRNLPKLYSVVTPHSLMDEPSANYIDKIKNFPSRVIGFFGDEISQKAQRRGSFLDQFRREKAMRMSLGATERQANEIAKIKAAETVNNVYYNLESVTPFLKNMNNVIPFFTAAWEIAQTWAYKIPMMQGPFPVGHIAMVRRIDRVTDALRELGLVRYDENGQPALVLDAEASGFNVFGDSLSRAGATVIRQPLMIAEHLFNLGHALTSSDDEEWAREDGIVPDRFQFSVSTPIDIEHYGIGSALDISLSMQPVAQFAASQLRQQIPAIASHKEVESSGTIAAIAEENEVDPRRLIGYNVDVLREALDPETVNLLLTGALSIDEVELEGVSLRMPNTSMFSQFVDRTFFPFGDLDTPGEVFTQFQPSWVKYVWRGLGLWQSGNTEDGFLGINMNSTNKAAVAGQVISSLRHLEATEGVYEKIDQYREEFYALAQPYLDARTAEIRNGELYWKGELPPDADTVNAAWQTLSAYSDAVLQRAIENAASSTMMRGWLAMFLPGTPRMFYEEEKIVDEYYAAQNAKNEQTSLIPRTSIDATVEYIQQWAADETGGRSMRLFLESHPELAPYLQGKSYWGPGGQPPLERSLELYFEDIEQGLREPVSPDVFLHRSAVSANETERQVAFIEEFGNDPANAAALSLADPQRYNEIMEEFNTKREMLAWEDELNGGAYAEWRNRNREENFSIIEESLQKYNDFNATVSDMIQIVEANPLMNIDEIEMITGELKGLKAGLSKIREELEQTDREYGWMQPHMRYRMEYFDKYYGQYLDAASEIYDRIATASTSEEQDYLWNQIASLKDVMDQVPPEIGGVMFPPVTYFQYENKDPEIRAREQVQQITYKPEWLGTQNAARIIAERPQLDKYLPSTPMQHALYDTFNASLEELDVMYQNGAGPMTYKEYRRRKDALEAQLENALVRSGNGDQVMWRYFWPVQKLAISGDLPEVILSSGFVEQASAIQRHRIADGYVSVGEDDPGRRALTRQIFNRAETDPAFLEALTELGITLYGESLIDEIIPILFFNDRF